MTRVQHFEHTGLFKLLSRDALVKAFPEKWQQLSHEKVASYDVVLCFEARVFDHCIQGKYPSHLSLIYT